MISRKITVTLNDCLNCPYLYCSDYDSKKEPVWTCKQKNQIVRKDKLGYLPIPDFCPLDHAEKKDDEDNQQPDAPTGEKPLQSGIDPL